MKSSTRTVLRCLEKLEFGDLELKLSGGSRYVFKGQHSGPRALLQIHDEKVFSNLALHGDIAFAKDYWSNMWDSPDIAKLLECALLNKRVLRKYISGSGLWKFIHRFSYLLNRNTRAGSRKNILSHYDLGNEFYSLWLDPTMTYSCALFEDSTTDLQNAQLHKYDRIIELINSNAKSVLEVGCGWGGFLERCLNRTNTEVTGVTVSPAQYAYATSRLKDRESANLFLQDYRDINGSFDSIVSIEMFEAVGEQYWDTFFRKMKSLLAKSGNAIIQTITIQDSEFERYRKTGDAIRSYVFPGGMLPSPKVFENLARKAGLKMTNKIEFGEDYVRTLNDWLKNFETQSDSINKRGFDAQFRRFWKFYLSYCAAAFQVKQTNVMQVELRHV